MADAPLRILLRQLHRLHAAPEEPADGELLERFVRTRDESAFELLLSRHGSLVYNVCRRVLRDAHAAEDALQATFLVLARKAASVGRGEALAGWLYRVAYRVALRARSRFAPATVAELPEPAAEGPDDALWRDLRSILDEEVGRLPEKYRLPVIHCYLSGLTADETARRMGIPRGTVLSRLAWARERLRGRLSRRGVTLSAAALGVLLGRTASRAPAAAVRAAMAFAAGQTTAASAGAVHLMQGVLRDMVLNKIKNGLFVVLALAAVGVGVGLWVARPATAEPPERRTEEAPAKQADPKAARAPEAPRPLGTWERKVTTKEGTSVTLTIRIEANRITATQSFSDKGKTTTATVEGEYSVTRDYLLYGVVTGVDVTGEMEDNDLSKAEALVMDQPFSVRYRVDGDTLTIHGLKVGGASASDADKLELQVFAGRYKKKAGGEGEGR